ncbi:MAG: hypothetical protein FD167_6102 [bacterium]|nr:MAG: hypothetical protein FD167_6102 [bacterium]
MGIGFVLFIYLFVGLSIAVIVGIVRVIKTNQENAGKSTSSKTSPIKQFLAPIGTVLYFFLTLIVYIVWCQAVLREDMGDAWQVKLPNRYVLQMIDTMDKGIIEFPTNKPSLEVTKIGQDKNMIFGQAQEGYFVLDTSTGQLWIFDSEKKQQDQCNALGITSNALTLGEFYDGNRSWFLSLLPIIVMSTIFFFIRSQSRRTLTKQISGVLI